MEPRNLKEMLAEAKDTSELMVDLAYAAVYSGDPDMAEGVVELEETLSGLVHDMRSVCVIAVRSPREADGMSSVLQVISAIERIGNNAVDIGRIVTHRLGIPADLIVDLHQADEVAHRLTVVEGAAMAGATLADLALPTEVGMRIVALGRDRTWTTRLDGDTVIVPRDVLYLHGSPGGIDEARRLAGAADWVRPMPNEGSTLTDLDRAIDALVEMKNISEAAVGLAYSTLLMEDPRLAAEVNHLEDRLDEMQEKLELWVLAAGASGADPAKLRGLLHLSRAAEDIGDQAQQMVWPLERGEDVHPVLALALGDADEIVAFMPVAAGSDADGASLAGLRLDRDPGFHVLAVRRSGRYIYRPGGAVTLQGGDELIATGPDEGQALLAERCGYRFTDDPDTGAYELTPI